MSTFPTTAIIGAGSSGITVAKALHERGLPFECFEISGRVGGIWVFGNRNGLSAAYRDLHIELFRRVFAPGNRSLAFVGLLQPLGAIMPLAEAQGRWLAGYLLGRYHLPPRRAMEADIRRESTRMRQRFVTSKRHTIQVDFDRYLLELRKERRRGAERVRAAGFARPLPARPQALAVAA